MRFPRRKEAGMIRTRHHQRSTRINCDGWISPVDGFATRPCRVIGMTDHDAKVFCSDESFLTKRFRLKLQPTGSRGRLCEVIRRQGPEATVRFIE
jgi:hypothetical protein